MKSSTSVPSVSSWPVDTTNLSGALSIRERCSGVENDSRSACHSPAAFIVSVSGPELISQNR